MVSEDDLESFFDNSKMIDLYNVVFKNTDWPLASYSIKDIAAYLGFKWRDETPSGALSIQWYNEYLKTNDEKIKKRILDYNENDCKATMILKDFLVK
ncbi:TM0106 family RecB-like putative nuclease [Patescibacteria group bacterium]|nr:TM0106 family RecB-like putative nuclease [Patescibacteria group bacterium]MBU4455599.1 TM0106 family RecB-like putative nuclease [Patescibacteria group bacterium]